MLFKDENIWIIGASSGIGEELAKQLADEGATLILSARREDELKRIKKELSGKGHLLTPLDVADSKQVSKAANSISKKVKRIDRVIFMAAIYSPRNIADMDVDFTRQLIEVNLLGGIYTSCAILPIFKKQKSGQLALCASCAGYTGLPGGQPYSASKAGLINFAESLCSEVGKNIDIKVINPGFVHTPMTYKNDFDMPMSIGVGQAAKAIIKGLKKKSFEISFPRVFIFIMKLLALMPYPIKLFFTRKMVKKT